MFSIQDLAVKERLLREEKLTLENAVGMARAAEASKGQIKGMNSRVQSSEVNQSVNVLRNEANHSVKTRFGANQGNEQRASNHGKTKSEKCGSRGMVHASRL